MVSEKNKDGGVVIAPAWASEPDPSKVHWRPPIYNAEDYLGGLARRGGPQTPPQHPSEMSLRQFETTSDLLAKLATDLRLAYPSFVQEFVSGGGVGLLVEVLRGVQVKQPSGRRRQTLRDELNCLQAVEACLRSPEAPRRLAASSPGLFTLAASIMSNVNKSRVLALQILGRTCGEGHGAVSDAMSTMRLRFGEPVRFRFLCGMLAGACPQLLLAGLSFINSFLESAPSPQARLYIQAELDQAGFSPQHLSKTVNSKMPLGEEVGAELQRWHRLFVDVNLLRARESELSRQVTLLKDRVHHLERRLQVLQEEKSVASSKECRLESRCQALEREVSCLRGSGGGGGGGGGGLPSTPAEDEGISSSGQDDPPDNALVYRLSTLLDTPDKQDEETTIEEVMEELQNIINDAESDYKHKASSRKEKEETAVAKHYTRYMQRSSNDLSSPYELEIVPDKLLPHPPRRARSLYLEREYRYSMFFEDEDSADNSNSDSMLSGVHEPEGGYNEDRARRRGAILAKEAQKNFIKRRETFHSPQQEKPDPVTPQEILPEIKARRGSFDGLFHQDSHSSKNSTKIYIEPAVDEPKSVGHDGKKETYFKQKRFEDNIRYAADRTVFLPVRNDPSPTSTQKFVVKQVHRNAGLYSGKNITREANCRTDSCDFYNRSLGSLGHANLTVSAGKLTDLPSGLY